MTAQIPLVLEATTSEASLVVEDTAAGEILRQNATAAEKLGTSLAHALMLATVRVMVEEEDTARLVEDHNVPGV